MTKAVLFVCTGNTCRSVMAEHLMRHYAQEAGLDIDVASAGVGAFSGDEATEHTLTVLAEMGIDASQHRSRRMHPLLLEEFDLILPMTESHRRALLDLLPEREREAAAEKIFLLKEYGKRTGFQGQDLKDEIEKDIQDPFGQSLEVYRRTRDEIAAEVKGIVKEWTVKKEKAMKIVIGSDHAGFQAKQGIVEHLQERGIAVADWGTSEGESCDYPDMAQRVGRAVADGEFTLGILICGTGIGMSIAANKVPGVRAALCGDTFSARMARMHNDSNILCLGGRVTGPGLMRDIVDAYLNAGFEGGRHARRVGKIE